MKVDIESELTGTLSGELEVLVFNEQGKLLEVREFKNSTTDASKAVVRGLLASDFENKMIDTISVGDGGDLEIAPPHNDTGQRVGPDPSETEMRSVIENLSIQIVSEVTNGVKYTALAKVEQANSDDINEFGLLTRDGTLVAHFVTEEVSPGGRARKYPKKSWMYLAIRWTVYYQ